MQVAVIKYNAGNTGSVTNALRRQGIEPRITDSPEAITAAEKVIFPGVGEASSAMRYLTKRGLDDVIRSLKQPVLGICLGMQLLCEHSDENDTGCLGIIPGQVRLFKGGDEKVPHMGWNTIENLAGPLFRDIAPGSYLYFVHSYFVDAHAASAATCSYGTRFDAAVMQGNFYGVQFHTEKSGEIGERILANFLNI